jgi:hypothetical protein
MLGPGAATVLGAGQPGVGAGSGASGAADAGEAAATGQGWGLSRSLVGRNVVRFPDRRGHLGAPGTSPPLVGTDAEGCLRPSRTGRTGDRHRDLGWSSGRRTVVAAGPPLGQEVFGGAVDGLLRGQFGPRVEVVLAVLPAQGVDDCRLALTNRAHRVEEVAEEEVE